jgi:CheY-like chemotaxis protein
VRHRPRILLVDDSPADHELIGAVLAGIDAELVSVATGKEGLDKASSEPFDAILLDILMPDLSGYEICRKLKADSETAEIPIIFVTARNREEDILRGFEALAFDFVLKPFHPRELRARVLNALRMKSLLDELRTRIRSYERCLRVGRELAQAASPADARRIINRELTGLVGDFEADGVSYSLHDRPDFIVSGDPTGPVAAEIPFRHAGLEGDLRLHRRIPCDPEECARLADFTGTLTRGLRRNPDLLARETAVSS